MTTELAVRPPQSNIGAVAIEQSEKLLEALIKSPVVGIVTAVALIEALQRVNLPTGKIDSSTGLPERTPLISQPLATTMESVIISVQSINALGLDSIAALLGLLK